MNIILGALYLFALYNMAFKPTKKSDKVTHWNYRFNGFCLAAGLTCLILKLLFGIMNVERAYIAFEFGDTLFFWTYLISSMLDIVEHSLAYKKKRSKGPLFGIMKAIALTIYKFFRTPLALKKLSALIFTGFAKKATKAAAYSTTLYAAVDLSGVLFFSIVLVSTAHLVGLRRLNRKEGIP
ncbi:hypothetical protein KFU94_15110 [Chloroflexi bacterium TSY]|nr:hypothetical protein [Chloroflexi bacterium TSY]